MSDDDLILESLERAGERCDDLAPLVYRHHGKASPEDAALMSHMDDYMRGRMLTDMLTLIMTPPADIDDGYLTFEVDSHRAYGVHPQMFRPMLEALREAVSDVLAADWNDAMARAWDSRIDAVLAEIDSHASA